MAKIANPLTTTKQVNIANREIECPGCGMKYPMEEAISSQLTQEISSKMEMEYADRLVKAEKDGFQKGQNKLQLENTDLQTQLIEAKTQLGVANKNELELRARERDVQARVDNVDLEVARRLGEGKQSVVDEITKKLDSEYATKFAKKEEETRQLNEKIAELNRKATQGSQQVQGEVAEKKLDHTLKTAFPMDHIERIGKGKKGADILHKVLTRSGVECGSILWEVKDEKPFKLKWIEKLKEDKARVNADVGVIVSTYLPKNIENFGFVDGIYITNSISTLPLAGLLRSKIEEIGQIKRSSVGKNEKGVQLLNYLQSPEFINAADTFLRSLVNMRRALHKEKDDFLRGFATREKHLETMGGSIQTMFGDFQGITGMSTLNIPAIENKKEEKSNEE